ncbi:MAG: hypothetical protein IKT46_09330 [Clostridia bacterium]|nr:hypothetical protein [Clostridia bacterium]
MFFNKKIICQKCKKKLSKKEFSSFSNENICISCYQKEKEKREKRESDANWQYIENNCRTLFTLHCDAYVSTTSVGFDISKKKPCIIRSHAFGPRDSWMYWSYYYIEFDELQDLAKKVSEEVYEKYKNMNEKNWKECI